MKPTVIDLFAGVGGLSLGFETDTILPWKLSEYLSKKGYL